MKIEHNIATRSRYSVKKKHRNLLTNQYNLTFRVSCFIDCHKRGSDGYFPTPFRFHSRQNSLPLRRGISFIHPRPLLSFRVLKTGIFLGFSCGSSFLLLTKKSQFSVSGKVSKGRGDRTVVTLSIAQLFFQKTAMPMYSPHMSEQ